MIEIRLINKYKSANKILRFNCDNVEIKNPKSVYNNKKDFITAVEFDLRNTLGIESVDFDYSPSKHNVLQFNTYLTHVKDFEPKFHKFVELVKTYKQVRENL